MSELNFNEIGADKIYTQVITTLEQECNEPLYPGDERRIFGEAVVAVFVSMYNTINDSARQKMLKYARGTVLDALGERTDTKRLEAFTASTTLRFTVSEIQASNIIIPAGTRVTTDGSIYFATCEAAVLSAGQEYVDVDAKAEEGGSRYNDYAVGTLTTLVDLIAYIGSVSNITVTAGGDDGEPYTTEGDDKYRERIRLSPSKFSTAGPYGAYEYYALSADAGIISVNVDSPEPGVVAVAVLMTDGEPPDAATLAKVQEALNNSKVRPLTDRVYAIAPTQVEYDIDIKYYTTRLNEAAVINAVEREGGAIERYIAWQHSALGYDINPDMLRKLILAPDWAEDLSGALRVEVTKPVFTELDNNCVAKFSGNLTVTHEVAEI